MSRRSHYRSSKGSRPGQHGTTPSSPGPATPDGPPPVAPRSPMPSAGTTPRGSGTPTAEAAGHLVAHHPEPAHGNGSGHAALSADPRPNGHAVPPANGHAPNLEPNGSRAPAARDAAPGDHTVDGHAGAPAGCTAPQLRRFIKSRSWVPMHELRRRFAINGGEDDVTPVAVDGVTIFVGLPHREGRLLGELFQAGDIGYELSMDPYSPIVIGVYPMRPVPRH